MMALRVTGKPVETAIPAAILAAVAPVSQLALTRSIFWLASALCHVNFTGFGLVNVRVSINDMVMLLPLQFVPVRLP